MNYQNFVFRFKPEQINAMILDAELLAKGYEFKYAIDTFDIVDYCLPYTDALFSNKSNRNFFAQRVVAYANFFKSNIHQTYICRQYQDEVKSISEGIQKKQQEKFRELGQNIDAILGHFADSAPDKTQKYDHAIRENLELLTTMLILDKEYGGVLRQRRHFISDSFKQINLEQEDYPGDDDILIKLSETEDSPLVPIVFSSFVDELAATLTNLKSKLNTYHYLDTTYADIEVIVKLATINRELNADNKKQILVYLSSTPKKTAQIFTILNRITTAEAGLPTVGDVEKFSFHRNIFQVFLLDKLVNRTPGNYESVKEALKMLRKTVSQVQLYLPAGKKNQRKIEDEISKHLTDTEKKDMTTVSDLLQDVSTDIENHFYYDTFLDLLDNADLEKEDTKKTQLLARAKEILETEVTTLSNITGLVNNLARFTNTQTLLNWFYQTKARDIKLHIYYGPDIIRNDFNHLPFLVFFPSGDNKISDELLSIADLVSTAIDLQGNKKKIIDLFKTAIERTDFVSKDFSEITNSVLLITWMNLITEIQPKQTGISDGQTWFQTETNLVIFLQRFNEIYRNSNLTPETVQKDQIQKIDYKRAPMPADIGHVLLWLLRRTHKRSECLKLGRALADDYPDDPRIHHGLALGLIDEYYHHRKKKLPVEKSATREIIEDALASLNRSLGLYQVQLDKKEAHTDKTLRLLAKSAMGVLNNLIDMLLRLFEIVQEGELLGEARRHLQQMKSLYAQHRLVYDDYPIPNYTEAELEYFEALQCFQNGQLSQSSVKIVYATNRAYHVKEKTTQMDYIFKSIIEDIDKLRTDIFRRLKII